MGPLPALPHPGTSPPGAPPSREASDRSRAQGGEGSKASSPTEAPVPPPAPALRKGLLSPRERNHPPAVASPGMQSTQLSLPGQAVSLPSPGQSSSYLGPILQDAGTELRVSGEAGPKVPAWEVAWWKTTVGCGPLLGHPPPWHHVPSLSPAPTPGDNRQHMPGRAL